MNETERSGLTKQRQAVLQVIREAHDHPTANEVFESARRILNGISFATVYNSLRYLKSEGLIAEVRLGTEGATRYDPKMTRHDHALCNSCGALVDLELPIPEGLLREGARRTKFEIESVELTLRGLCPGCSNDQ